MPGILRIKILLYSLGHNEFLCHIHSPFVAGTIGFKLAPQGLPGILIVVIALNLEWLLNVLIAYHMGSSNGANKTLVFLQTGSRYAAYVNDLFIRNYL